MTAFLLAPAYCNVCGRPTLIRIAHRNLRETCTCLQCGSFNRQRQLAVLLCRAFAVRNLTDFIRRPGLTVYNTEASRAIHDRLRMMPGYVASEYVGDE
jgi:hypothetical protein